MGKFDFDLVKGKTIFLASLPFFSFEKQTKEHILFQAQPSKKKKKQSTLSKAKLIATFQSKILGLGSLNNLACSRILGILCPLSFTNSNADKPMKKTVEIGLFFFFIHILVSPDSNIVTGAYPWKRLYRICRGGGGGRVYISPDLPP